MIKRASTISRALVAGLGITALATTRLPLLEALGLPGLGLAALLPFRSRTFSPAEVKVWVLSIWLGAFAFWSIVAFIAFSIIERRRAA